MASISYTPAGTFNDAALNAADKALISAAQQKWLAAYSKGDQAAMAAAHAEAEAVRAKYNYSGGADGSEFISLPSYSDPSSNNNDSFQDSSHNSSYNPPSYSSPSTVPDNSTPADLPDSSAFSNFTPLVPAASAAKYINELYNAQNEANLNALKAAYNQNVLSINAAGSSIPAQYQDARNSAAAQNELQRMNFNEFAAGRGLNTGAGSQAYLSMSNALLGNLSGISKAEADALASLDLQRAQIESAYQNDVAKAINDNNIAKAKALYDDFIRVDNSIAAAAKAQQNGNSPASAEAYYYALLQQAQTLAQYGDFSGYAALGYTPAQIEAVKEAFDISNNWYGR